MNATAFLLEQFEDKPRGRRSKQLLPLDVAIRDARHRAATGEWDGTKGSTLVGLYAMCHEMIYGVVPEELKNLGLFRAAARNSARALHEVFADDIVKCIEFVRWTWEREKRKNAWAQSNGVDRNRMSWKWQFSAGMVTDYRVSLQQKRR